MSNPTISAPTPKLTRAASKQKYISYLLFLLCASLYILPFMRLMLRGTDEGFLLDGAVRIVHGQVFARDFFEVVGPGTFYWLVFFFKLFGVTFLATRISLFLTSLGTALLLYFLACRMCPRYPFLPCILAFSTFFGLLWPAISHHTDSNFFALLAFACMVLWQDSRKTGLLIAAGALAGVTTCFLQPKGMLLVFAFLLWLWVQHRKQSVSLSSLGWVTGGYSAIAGIVTVYFWSHKALGDLVYTNFLWPFRHYDTVSTVPYARGLLLYYWDHWATGTGGIHWTVVMAAFLIPPFLLVAALPILLPILGFFDRCDFATPEVLLYWLCGWALWISEIHRKDICHLVFGSVLLMILCVHLLERYTGKLSTLALQILSISAVCLATFNLFTILTAHPVSTRRGTVAMFKDDAVLAFLNRHVAPGTNIFAYPYCPMYYFLSATNNPTRHSILLYNYNTPAQFHDVIHTLDQQKVLYIVWDTDFVKVAGAFFNMQTQSSQSLMLEPYLDSHYKMIKNLNDIHILKRK